MSIDQYFATGDMDAHTWMPPMRLTAARSGKKINAAVADILVNAANYAIDNK